MFWRELGDVRGFGNKMNTAVILAAGMGTRLRAAHADMPKGFLELDGRPIVEDSIARLEQAGIRDIIIVTGYGSEHYDQLALRYAGLVRTAHNPRYAESGSMYSLYCARDVIDDDCGFQGLRTKTSDAKH